MFAIEPMAAKALQPSLGGVPSVWTTCLLFFQLALLAGYLAQFALVRCKPARLQWALHLLVFLTPLLLSRFDFASALSGQSSSQHPVIASLWFLLRTVGLPFAALCTVAPSMQRYFTTWTGNKPYALYAASNAGSAAGLLLYPFVIEPWVPLAQQWAGLRVAYALVLVLVLTFAWFANGAGRARVAVATDTPASEDASDSSAPKETSRAWQWLSLSAIPSGLLATTSSTIAGDLPGIPLLWVTPLAVYLCTFILAFSRGRPAPKWVDRAALLLSIVLVPITLRRTTNPYLLLLILHLSFLVLVSFSAHCKLAAMAPPTKDLERYYLLISVGGVLGTLLFAIVPPQVFSDLWECPLTIAATALVPLIAPSDKAAEKASKFDWVLAALPALWLLIAALVTRLTHAAPVGWALAVAYVPVVLLCGRAAKAPWLLALALAGTAVFGAVFERSSTLTLAYGRSFFGTTRVQAPPGLAMHVLVHGTTIHGAERIAARGQCEQRSYYRADGPVGRIFSARRSHFADGSVFAIGLGAGAIVCYARPTERWTFVEIDPDVVRVARDPALFSFLSHNPLPSNSLNVVVGDGRLVLNQQRDAQYSMLLVDAFNSDSVPLHLLTRQAFQRYFAKLTPDGWLILHISNHALDLPRVVSAIVRAEGLAARINEDASEFSARGNVPTWTVIARTEAGLSALPLSAGWLPLPEPRGLPAFTDDYASILRAMR